MKDNIISIPAKELVEKPELENPVELALAGFWEKIMEFQKEINNLNDKIDKLQKQVEEKK